MSRLRPIAFAWGAATAGAALLVVACSGFADVPSLEVPAVPETGAFTPADEETHLDAGPHLDADAAPDASGDAGAGGADAGDRDAAAAALVLSAPSASATSEDGGTVTFTVRLATRPSADVIVALAVTDPDEARVTPSFLAFTPSDWSSPQTVTVTGEDDAAADGDRPFSVRLGSVASADPAYAGLGGVDLPLRNRDDDAPGIEVSSPLAARTTEAGGTVTFTVVLRSRPTASVSVPVSVDDPGEARVASGPVAFGPDDWDVPRTVELAGVDDDVDDGDQVFRVILGPAESVDLGYAGIDAPDVALVNADDDEAAITVETVSTTTSELGGTASVRVRLASRPTASVTIPVSTTRPAEAVATAASVVIEPAAFATPVTVTVEGVDDGAADGDQAFSLVLGAATSDDPRYAGRDPADVAMTNTDRPRDGTSQGNAARTCATLEAAFGPLPSGTYWIDPDAGPTSNAFQGTCDMALDGGGWTMLGRGPWWLAEDDALPAGAMLGPARLASVLAASGKLFRLGTGASRLFVRDASARVEKAFGYWRTDGAAVLCATTYAAVTGDTMVSASVLEVSCDPKGVGSHACGSANGWLLFSHGDTYNPGATHPCAFGVGEQPVGGSLLDLWVR